MIKKMKTIFMFILSSSITWIGCSNQKSTKEMENKDLNSSIKLTAVENFPDGKEIATFAGGCFWCTEAIFEEVKGVEKVISGYTGGQKDNPTYEQVCNGTTGHAEAIQIIFDPAVVDYITLLDIFMRTHEPTSLNKQGNDIGTQYRSAIYFHNENQKSIALKYIETHNADLLFGGKIVTEVAPFTKYYEAEGYHQDYFANNADQPYCVFVVAKKVEKFEQLFPEKVKENYK